MKALVVVENPARWPLRVDGIEVVSAREYLTEDRYSDLKRAAVFNMCRRYGYQTVGYYVSLLAQARGHRPIPSVGTLQALGSTGVVRLVSEDLESLIQKSLAPLVSDEFTLSIYFGRNLASRYDALARALFNAFPAPLLRARFVRERSEWSLVGIRPIPTSELPDEHRPFAVEQAKRFFRRPSSGVEEEEFRYDLAILWSEHDQGAPSDAKAIRKFIRAAEANGMHAEVIDADELAKIAEYDALFIRETTAVEHHTYRMARKAHREGMIVIDDPESIIRCSNKVYQAELFRRHGIATPYTLVVHEGNTTEIETEVGLPCVLKRPDGSFSQGVVKATDRADLGRILPALFEESELVIAQEWTPSDFDWRVGVLDGKALFACRYHMARGHWQIVQKHGQGGRYGRVEAVPLDEVPERVRRLAVRAAGLIGDGFYGVDLKEVKGRPVVMEVNDNPNVDAGLEDGIIGDALYDRVMKLIRSRLDERGAQPRKAGR